MAQPVRSKILRRQRTPGEYALYKAALEWDLEDPIVIEKREDFKSELRWHDRLQPYHHQVTNLISFCRRLPVTLLADDVGLGKTISAGLVVSELIARSRIKRILVVCPKLLGPQWQEELSTKFDLPADIAIGQELIDAEPEDVGAVITTYASARLHLDKLPDDRFQMLVLDEAHKLRNLYGVDTPPQVAKKFRKALENRRFRFVLMLTATPIHNRLWDLYSLVDLLTVARGHQNPFGSEGMFARKYIADNREQARRLRPEAKDEFRSIVYQYMSRVRRGDARLYFPDREVQLHRVEPTAAELALIGTIAKPIEELNRLAQISILQALASSPDALLAQLRNMAMKGTVPQTLVSAVEAIVHAMPLSAKLTGLHALISRLKKESPDKWRLVVFTTRLETQTTIQSFLEKSGLKVGIINGKSGSRNQETIAKFRSDPPQCHVIVSTEAGSEGVNLQVANVLVNFDLPWNPMIVEQRIGRIQRLGSRHAKVGIFNIILRGTFEEYIVGRLMEKLQMASHAIGDIEALLEASGIDDDDDSANTFEEKVLELVLASLTGKNVELEVRQAEQSIAKAKEDLQREQATIDDLLGDARGKEYSGPRAPALPAARHSMPTREFSLAGLRALGVKLIESAVGVVAEQNGTQEPIHFEGDSPAERSTLYAPGEPAFSRLVAALVASGVHDINDLDGDPENDAKLLANDWTKTFGSNVVGMDVRGVRRHFEGKALVRVRATVAHDSYERLVEVACSSDDQRSESTRSFLAPIGSTIEDPRAVGLIPDDLGTAAKLDDAISEFCRFYSERRELEVGAAGDDERKRKKLEDDFTPRLDMTIVGLQGRVNRMVEVSTKYRIDDADYSSSLTINPYLRAVTNAPTLGDCAVTRRTVPSSCLKQCQISGGNVLAHLLVASEKTGRLAIQDHVLRCAVTEKRLLRDELEKSGITGNMVDKTILKTSAISGTRGEPQYFAQCEFTGAEVLKNDELAVSEVSNRRYRQDQRQRSVVSGRTGHKDEFIVCAQTGHSLLLSEAEKCEVTGAAVQPGILQRCEVSGKRVLPSELEVCFVTNKKALKSLLVSSSLSGIRLLGEAAIRSVSGKFCAPGEAKQCAWSGRTSHPDDLRVCELTGLRILFQFAGSQKSGYALQSLLELLDGIRRNSDKAEVWPALAANASTILRKGRCQVEAAVLSPSGRHLAAALEVRTMLGFKVRQAGVVFSMSENSVIGRIAQGQRKSAGWARAET
jgi:superfamily II DNA or RNA helicase